MVADTQRKNALVYPEPWRVEVEFGRFLVDRFDRELLVVEANVPDLTPRESDLGRQPINRTKNNCCAHSARI